MDDDFADLDDMDSGNLGADLDDDLDGGPSGISDDGQMVLKEDYDPNYEPSQEDIAEYAEMIEVDLDKYPTLVGLVKEGIKAPLPKPWKPCQDAMTNEMYYFNFETEESSWEHPADIIYKDKAAIAMADLDAGGNISVPGAAPVTGLDTSTTAVAANSSLHSMDDEELRRDLVPKFKEISPNNSASLEGSVTEEIADEISELSGANLSGLSDGSGGWGARDGGALKLNDSAGSPGGRSHSMLDGGREAATTGAVDLDASPGSASLSAPSSPGGGDDGGGDYSDEEFEPDDDDDNDDDDDVPGSESISEIASEVYSGVEDDPTDPLDGRGSPTEIPRRSVSPSPGPPIPAANAATPTSTPPAAAASPAAPGSSGKAQIAAEIEAVLQEYRRVTEKKLEGNKQTLALEYERKLSLAKQQLEVKNAVAKDDAEQKAKEELAAFKADLVNSTETERGKVRDALADSVAAMRQEADKARDETRADVQQEIETFRKQTLAAVNAEVQAEREQLRETLLREMREEMKAEMREQRQTETAELEKQLDAEEKELAGRLSERAARVAKDKDILAQLEAQAVELQASVDTVRNEKAALSKAAASSRDEAAELKASIAETERACTESRAALQDLRETASAERANLDREREAAQAMDKAAQDHATALTSQIEQLVADGKVALAEKQEAIEADAATKLQAIKASVAAKLSFDTAALDDSAAAIGETVALKSELAALRKDVSRLQADLAAANRQRDGLQTGFDLAQRENDTLQADLEAAHEAFGAERDRERAMTEEAVAQREREDAALRAAAAAEALANASNDTAQRLKDAAALDAAVAASDKHTQVAADLTSRLIAAEQNAAALAVDLATAKAALTDAGDPAAPSAAVVSDLEAQIALLTNELATAVSNADEFATALEERNGEAVGVEARLRDNIRELQEALGAVDERAGAAEEAATAAATELAASQVRASEAEEAAAAAATELAASQARASEAEEQVHMLQIQARSMAGEDLQRTAAMGARTDLESKLDDELTAIKTYHANQMETLKLKHEVELVDLSTKLSGELQELLMVNEENVRSAQQQHSRHLEDLTNSHAEERSRSEAALDALKTENKSAESQVRSGLKTEFDTMALTLSKENAELYSSQRAVADLARRVEMDQVLSVQREYEDELNTWQSQLAELQDRKAAQIKTWEANFDADLKRCRDALDAKLNEEVDRLDADKHIQLSAHTALVQTELEQGKTAAERSRDLELLDFETSLKMDMQTKKRELADSLGLGSSAAVLQEIQAEHADAVAALKEANQLGLERESEEHEARLAALQAEMAVEEADCRATAQDAHKVQMEQLEAKLAADAAAAAAHFETTYGEVVKGLKQEHAAAIQQLMADLYTTTNANAGELAQVQHLLREQTARSAGAATDGTPPRGNSVQAIPHNDQSTPRRGRPPPGDDLDLSYFANANPAAAAAAASAAPAHPQEQMPGQAAADPASQAYAADLDALRDVFTGQLHEYQASLAKVQAELSQLKSAQATSVQDPPPPRPGASDDADANAAANAAVRVPAGAEPAVNSGDRSVEFSVPPMLSHITGLVHSATAPPGGVSRRGTGASTSRVTAITVGNDVTVGQGRQPLENAASRLNRTRDLLLRADRILEIPAARPFRDRHPARDPHGLAVARSFRGSRYEPEPVAPRYDGRSGGQYISQTPGGVGQLGRRTPGGAVLQSHSAWLHNFRTSLIVNDLM